MNRRARTIVVLSLLGIGTAAVVFAGPLSPPSGPVASTYKTLTEVEPRIAISAVNTPGDNDASPSLFKITQPGSYYLTGSIVGVSGKSGIEIAASGVSIDLNGFDIQGVSGSLAGVRMNAGSAYSAVEVRNGSVRGWGQSGVDLQSTGTGARIESVRTTDNFGVGLQVLIKSAVITSCVSSGNLSAGIAVSDNATLDALTSSDNGGNGVIGGANVSIRGATLATNSGAAIQLGDLARVESSILRCAQGTTAIVGSRAHVTGCSVYSVPGASTVGLQAGVASRISGNNFYSGGTALKAQSASHIESNLFDNSAGQSGAGTAVSFLSASVVRNNQVVSYNVGFHTAGNGSIVTGNVSRGCILGYDVAANNRYGAIVQLGAASAAGTSPAASTMTTTDPFANFSY